MLQLEDNEIRHLKRVVEYLYHDERKHWLCEEEEEWQRTHIFVSVHILALALDKAATPGEAA